MPDSFRFRLNDPEEPSPISSVSSSPHNGGKKPTDLAAHLDRMRSGRFETDVSSPLGILQKTGFYPCQPFVPSSSLSRPPDNECQFVRTLAASYFQIPEANILSVEHISEVLESGERVFFAGAFVRPPQSVFTGSLEALDSEYALLYPQHPEYMYRIRLSDGKEHWVSHGSSDPFSPLGNSVFTKPVQEAFDPHEFHPDIIPFSSPKSTLRDLLGRRIDLDAFLQQAREEIEQECGGDVDISFVRVGVSGQSGPLLRVHFPHDATRLPVYYSAQQLIS